jgi:protein TonB
MTMAIGFATLVLALVQQAATDPVPASHPPTWITYRDYPQQALRAGEQGKVAFRLDVAANGRVTGCTITLSSGSELLDSTACRLLKRRARFTPARNAAGEKVAGTWSNAFAWSMP